MEPVIYDIASYDKITNAIMELVNKYPGLQGEMFTFSVLSEDGGLAIFPISGAVVQSERKSITGHVKQNCAYPFMVVMRENGLNESRKANAKEWLDKFGTWLEKQPITFDGDTFYKLDEYPNLTEGRKIEEVKRQSVAYLDNQGADGVEDWCISIQLKYSNEYDL